MGGAALLAQLEQRCGPTPGPSEHEAFSLWLVAGAGVSQILAV